MAIENTYLLGKNITLGCGFDLQAKAPLDSRQTVPAFAGLQALIDGNAAYEGMIVYDEETKKTYQAQLVDDVLSFREFGINEAELKDLIASETTAAMEFKGAATALPENPAKGDMYKVTATFKVGDEDVKVGDSIVYDGEQWFIIPSGDDIEDTWRPVTGVDNDSTLTFAAGDKLEKTVAADGTITYKHVAIDAPVNMNSDEDEATRTYITQLIADNHGHIIGFKTATENVEDTNTTYTFEGQSDEATSVYFQVTSSEEGASAEVIYLDAYSKNEADAELAKKVDKVEGFSLVSDTEIARLAEVDNYDDEEVRGLIGDNAKAIEDIEAYVGTIPTDEKYADITNVISYVNKKAEETLAAAQGGSSETAASVKQQLDNYKSENDTRVKAVEEDIVAINNADTGILKQANDYADSLAGNYDENGAAAGVQAALEVEIGKKADSDAMTTELGKKADKTVVEGIDTRVKAIEDAPYVTKGQLDVVDAKFASYTNTETLNGLLEGVNAAIAAAEKSAKDYADANDSNTEYAAGNGLELGADNKFAIKIDETSFPEEPSLLAVGENGLKVDYTWFSSRVDSRASDVVTKYYRDVLQPELNAKANAVSTYTKDETNHLLNAKANASDVYTKTEADGLLGAKADASSVYTKTEADAAFRTETQVDGQIDAKIAALNLATTYEPIGAETRAKAYADGLITDANLAQYTTEQEVKDIVDEVIAGAVDGDTITGLANLVEYLNTHGTEAKEMGAAIDVLEGKVEIIEGKPAYGITATQISNWDNEVGAKALAESKTTTAEVKAQIEAYGYATTGYADGKAADAQAAAIADAAGKYETKGTAQGIVDGLKLSETYEPIGAEGRAIAAAKTETENQIKALTEGAIADNASDIADIIEMLTWGEF